jgi:hypothetical protein
MGGIADGTALGAVHTADVVSLPDPLDTPDTPLTALPPPPASHLLLSGPPAPLLLTAPTKSGLHLNHHNTYCLHHQNRAKLN